MMKQSVSKTFPQLAKYLQSFGFEKELDEISYQICKYNNSNKKSDNIVRTDFDNSVNIEVSKWDVKKLCKWIRSLEFMKGDNSVIEAFETQEIDGFTFLFLNENEWIQSLHLDIRYFILLRSIRDGWLIGWGPSIHVPEGIPAGIAANIIADLSSCSKKLAMDLIEADSLCTQTGQGMFYGQLVTLGYREYHFQGEKFLPVGQNNDKFVMRRRQVPNGFQYARTDIDGICCNSLLPIESAGRSLSTHQIQIKHTSQQDIPSTSGINLLTECICPSESKLISNDITFSFTSDPSRDVFQIGRMVEPHNDFVVSGPQHTDISGKRKGPISRFACRIECERLPPYRCYIYAGGFCLSKSSDSNNNNNNNTTNNNNCNNGSSSSSGNLEHTTEKKRVLSIEGDLHWLNDSLLATNSTAATTTASAVTATTATTTSSSSSSSSSSELYESFDAFTTYGIKLYKPETGIWREVSVQGHLYPVRNIDSSGNVFPSRIKCTEENNELTEGCIIDLCGCSLLFQKPAIMALQNTMEPEKVIAELNRLKPQCPVLCLDIHFTYLNSRERALRVISKLEAAGIGYVPSGPFHIPLTDYSDVEEETRSYVFTACGHVHGYHKSLEGRPCPLCRTIGAFVPIAFAFEPAICDRKPTHVFNPCGHVACKETCDKFSKIHFYDYSTVVSPAASTSHIIESMNAQCPFCATKLCTKQDGGPFNRLILQTENGQAWEEDEADIKNDRSCISNSYELNQFNQINSLRTSLKTQDSFDGCNESVYLSTVPYADINDMGRGVGTGTGTGSVDDSMIIDDDGDDDGDILNDAEAPTTTTATTAATTTAATSINNNVNINTNSRIRSNTNCTISIGSNSRLRADSNSTLDTPSLSVTPYTSQKSFHFNNRINHNNHNSFNNNSIDNNTMTSRGSSFCDTVCKNVDDGYLLNESLEGILIRRERERMLKELQEDCGTFPALTSVTTRSVGHRVSPQTFTPYAPLIPSFPKYVPQLNIAPLPLDQIYTTYPHHLALQATTQAAHNICDEYNNTNTSIFNSDHKSDGENQNIEWMRARVRSSSSSTYYDASPTVPHPQRSSSTNHNHNHSHSHSNRFADNK